MALHKVLLSVIEAAFWLVRRNAQALRFLEGHKTRSRLGACV